MSLPEVLKEVDGRLLFNESKKRPILYSKTLNYLIENLNIINPSFIREAFKEERLFLLLAIAEVFVKKPKELYKAFLRALKEDQSLAAFLGLSNLGLYRVLREGTLNIPSSEVDINFLLNAEECLKYSSDYGKICTDVFLCVEDYISKLLGFKGDVVKALSLTLPLKSSVIKVPEVGDYDYYTVIWPYTIILNKRDHKLKWLYRDTSLKVHEVEAIDASSDLINIMSLGDGAVLFLKDSLKTKAVISSPTMETTRVIIGDSICYDNVNSIYSVEFSDKFYLRRYDERGNKVFEKVIQGPESIRSVSCFPMRGRGVLFNISTRSDSWVIASDNRLVNVQRFKNVLNTIISLPLGYNIAYSDNDLYILSRFQDSIKVLGPYSKPSVGNVVFTGAVDGFGIMMISDNDVLQVNSLGNVISKQRFTGIENILRVKHVQTSLPSSIILIRSKSASKVYTFIDGTPVELEPSCLGIVSDIVDITYNKGVLCLNSIDGSLVCISPLYLDWILKNKLKYSKIYIKSLGDLISIYDKVRSSNDLSMIFGLEVPINAEILEEVMHLDSFFRSLLASKVKKDIATSLERVLKKLLKYREIVNYLDMILIEYRDHLRAGYTSLTNATTSKLLPVSNSAEVHPSILWILDQAVDWLRNIKDVNDKSLDIVIKNIAKLLGVIELLNAEQLVLKNILEALPESSNKVILKNLVACMKHKDTLMYDISVNVLKELGYALPVLENKVKLIISDVAKVLEIKDTIKHIEDRYNYYLSNADFDELIEYLKRLEELLRTIKELNDKALKEGLSIMLDSEFRFKVSQCIASELLPAQLYECKNTLTSIFECNIKLRELLNDAYKIVKPSKIIDTSIIDNKISSYRSCEDRIRDLIELKSLINTLVSMEYELTKITEELTSMQYIGQAFETSVDNVREAIKKLDRQLAKTLIEELKIKVKELKEINNNLAKLQSFKGIKQLSPMYREIDYVISEVVKYISSGTLEDLRKVRTNITRTVSRLDVVHEAIESLEIPLREFIKDSERINKLIATILKHYLISSILNDFDLGWKEFNKLTNLFKACGSKLRTLIERVSQAGNILKDIGLEQTLSLLNPEIYVDEITKELELESMQGINESLQKILQKIDSRINILNKFCMELNYVKSTLSRLEDEVKNRLTVYLNNIFKGYSELRNVTELNDLLLKLSHITSPEVLNNIIEFDLKIKEFKEIKNTLTSRYAKQITDSIMDKVLVAVGKLRFDEAAEHLRTFSEVILGLKPTGLDDIINTLEINGLNINEIKEIKLVNDPVKQVMELNKLRNIRVLIELYPKVVTKSISILGSIDRGIYISRLAYIMIDKLSIEPDLILMSLDSVKSDNLVDVILFMLINAGEHVYGKLGSIDRYLGAHAIMLKIFEDYPASETSCKDAAGGALEDVSRLFCELENLELAIPYTTLYCIKDGVACYKLLGLLGGYYSKVLKHFLSHLSKTFNTEFKDADLVIVEYVVKPYWKLKKEVFEKHLTKLINLLSNMAVELERYKDYLGGYVSRTSAIEILRAIEYIHRMLNDKEFYRNELQRGLQYEAYGELIVGESSNITLKICNSLNLPLDVNEITLRLENFYEIKESEVGLIEPGKCREIRLTLPKLIFDERFLERGRELRAIAQSFARIPKVYEKYTYVVGHDIYIPVVYYGLRSNLMRYLEDLRSKISNIEIPYTLHEALLGAGGNNVVLVGISRDDGKRVVVKVPGFLMDLRNIPSISLSIIESCIDYANRCTDATRACSNKVARVRTIEINPPYAVEDYVEGMTVRSILLSKGSLTKDDAIHIAIEVGEALECLHKFGVFHNDVRPENVMVVKGSVILIDACIDEVWNMIRSGIPSARLTSSSVGDRIDEAYTHPLILRKLREGSLTAEDRAMLDVFQLGLMIYEMILGYNPMFKIKNATDIESLRLLPPYLSELENLLISVVSPTKLPELSINEFVKRLKNFL
jgi:hypothetical protein